MGLNDIFGRNREYKFSPTLKADFLNQETEKLSKKKKHIVTQFDIFSKDNKITQNIINLRGKVENSFGTKEFEDTYYNYVQFLNGLFAFTVGFMQSDKDYFDVNQEAMKNYIGSSTYKKLPYAVKNTIVLHYSNPIKEEEILNYINKTENNYDHLYKILGELLVSSTKIITIKMQDFIENIVKNLKDNCQEKEEVIVAKKVSKSKNKSIID